MNARLLTDVWRDIADPWSRTGLGHFLWGTDLAHARHNLSRVGHDFHTGRDFASAEHDRAHSFAPGAAPPGVVVDVHSFLSPGDPLPETSVEVIAAIVANEGIPIAKEGLRRLPVKPLYRLMHHVAHAVREDAKGPADDARRALEAVIRLDGWFLGVNKVSGFGAPTGSLTQVTVQTGNELRLQKGMQPGSLVHSGDAFPGDHGQAHQGALDAD